MIRGAALCCDCDFEKAAARPPGYLLARVSNSETTDRTPETLDHEVLPSLCSGAPGPGRPRLCRSRRKPGAFQLLLRRRWSKQRHREEGSGLDVPQGCGR